MRRLTRWLGTILIVTGVLSLAWALLIWRWQDPFTALYTSWQQRELRHEYQRQLEDFHPPPAPLGTGRDLARYELSIAGAARRYRRGLKEGEAIGRIVVPRLGLHMVFVNGTTGADAQGRPRPRAVDLHAGRGQARSTSPGTARPTSRRSPPSTSSGRGTRSSSSCPTGPSSTGSPGTASSPPTISPCSSRTGGRWWHCRPATRASSPPSATSRTPARFASFRAPGRRTSTRAPSSPRPAARSCLSSKQRRAVRVRA